MAAKPPKASKLNDAFKAEDFVPPADRPDEVIPDLRQVFDAIASHILADTLDVYLRAMHRALVIRDRVAVLNYANDVIEHWVEFANSVRDTARDNVIRGIFRWYYPKWEDTEVNEALNKRYPGLAIAYHGRIFAINPDQDGLSLEMGKGFKDNRRVMFLWLMEPMPGQEVSPDLYAQVDLDQFFGRSATLKPAVPVGEPETSEEPASIFGGRLSAPDDVRLNAPVK